MTKIQDKRILQIRIPKEYERHLRMAVSNAGYVRGKSGNLTAALIGLANGECRLVNNSKTVKESGTRLNSDLAAKIHAWIDSQTPFQVLTYEKNVPKSYDVLSAKISLHQGMPLLYAYVKQVNAHELNELAHNQVLDLDRIVDATALIDDSWIVAMPTLQILFFLNSNASTQYQKTQDDTSLRAGEIKNIQGVFVTRSILSSSVVIKELLAYGSDCHLISPESFRTMLLQELSKIFDLYSD